MVECSIFNLNNQCNAQCPWNLDHFTLNWGWGGGKKKCDNYAGSNSQRTQQSSSWAKVKRNQTLSLLIRQIDISERSEWMNTRWMISLFNLNVNLIFALHPNCRPCVHISPVLLMFLKPCNVIKCNCNMVLWWSKCFFFISRISL